MTIGEIVTSFLMIIGMIFAAFLWILSIKNKLDADIKELTENISTLKKDNELMKFKITLLSKSSAEENMTTDTLESDNI
jgi:hypothetical protein